MTLLASTRPFPFDLASAVGSLPPSSTFSSASAFAQATAPVQSPFFPQIYGPAGTGTSLSMPMPTVPAAAWGHLSPTSSRGSGGTPPGGLGGAVGVGAGGDGQLEGMLGGTGFPVGAMGASFGGLDFAGMQQQQQQQQQLGLYSFGAGVNDEGFRALLAGGGTAGGTPSVAGPGGEFDLTGAGLAGDGGGSMTQEEMMRMFGVGAGAGAGGGQEGQAHGQWGWQG